MKKKKIFDGVATALATPFSGGEVDFCALEKMIEYQIDGGVEAIVVCGTTGESPALTDAETHRLIDRCAELIDGRAKMIVGTGSLVFPRAMEQSRFAAAHGADALLVITPFYNKGTKNGIAEYYKRIANATDKPVIIYNVPTRTGVDITLDTLDKIYREENIVGIKEASPSIDKALDISSNFPALAIYSGNDTMTLPIMSVGGSGVISVISNALPKKCVEMCRAYRSGEQNKATAIQRSMTAIMHMMFEDTSPAPIKAALSMLGLCENELRLPLTPISRTLYEKIQHELSQFI